MKDNDSEPEMVEVKRADLQRIESGYRMALRDTEFPVYPRDVEALKAALDVLYSDPENRKKQLDTVFEEKHETA